MIERSNWVAVLCAAALVACGGSSKDHDHEHNQDHHHEPENLPVDETEKLGDTDVLGVNADDAASPDIEADAGEVVTLPFNIQPETPKTRVKLTSLLSTGLRQPWTLGFKPVENSLWILNRGDDSTLIVDGVGTTAQKVVRFTDDSAHFMNNPSQISFSPLLPEFAASLDTNNDYNGLQAPNNFIGPTLYTTDRTHFEGGTMSHWDMLHHSPFAVGIAAGARPTEARMDMREYWVFNGQSGAIDRYFFRAPHELGGHDHSDGLTVRYAAGQLRRTVGNPGHLAFDQATKQLFIADTGNARIARLDTRLPLDTATRIRGWHSETPLYNLPGATLATVAGTSAGLVAPSGLLLYKNLLIVTDAGTGFIKLFTKQGVLQATVDTGLGRGVLAGLVVSPSGELLLLDAKSSRLLRFAVQ